LTGCACSTSLLALLANCCHALALKARSREGSCPVDAGSGGVGLTCCLPGCRYGNKCTAACANVAIAAQGECKPAAEAKPPACACNKMLAPVCGSNGKT